MNSSRRSSKRRSRKLSKRSSKRSSKRTRSFRKTKKLTGGAENIIFKFPGSVRSHLDKYVRYGISPELRNVCSGGESYKLNDVTDNQCADRTSSSSYYTTVKLASVHSPSELGKLLPLNFIDAVISEKNRNKSEGKRYIFKHISRQIIDNTIEFVGDGIDIVKFIPPSEEKNIRDMSKWAVKTINTDIKSTEKSLLEFLDKTRETEFNTSFMSYGVNLFLHKDYDLYEFVNE